MNEQIKKLAEEAVKYVNAVYTPPVRSKTPGKIWEDGHIDWHTQFNKQFANIIALECAKIAVAIPCPIEEGISRQTQGHTWDMACVAAATKIKEYFGMEP
jgi:hypothetical protein